MRLLAEVLGQLGNNRMRDELLNETVFTSMAQARAVIATGVADDNTARPHSALAYQTPAAHAAKFKSLRPSGAPSPAPLLRPRHTA